MSPRKAGKPTDAATLGRRAAHRTPATPGRDAAQLQQGNGSERGPATNPPRPRPRPVRHEQADHATPTRRRSTTPPTTLASDGHRHSATAASTLLAPGQPTNSDTKQLSAGMTATLFAQLEGRAAIDLVADIVRTVLDESRQSVRDRAAEPAMIEARQRLERLIRAGSSRLTQSTERLETRPDKTERPRRRTEADRISPIRPS